MCHYILNFIAGPNFIYIVYGTGICSYLEQIKKSNYSEKKCEFLAAMQMVAHTLQLVVFLDTITFIASVHVFCVM